MNTNAKIILSTIALAAGIAGYKEGVDRAYKRGWHAGLIQGQTDAYTECTRQLHEINERMRVDNAGYAKRILGYE